MKAVWSFRARQDMIDIGDYIAKDNRAAARAMLSRIRERVKSAVGSPLTGRVVPEFGNPEIREFVVGNYRVVYRIGRATNRRMVVLTVFEGHRLFPPEEGEAL